MNLQSRVDSWTSEEDKKLAEIVIQSVSEGNTQLKSFEIAAQYLPGRSEEACTFRWNATVRRQPENIKALEEAKEKGREFKKSKVTKRKPPIQEDQRIQVPKPVFDSITRTRQANKAYNIAWIEQREKELNRFIRNPETAKDYFTGLQVGFRPKLTAEEAIKEIYKTSASKAFQDGMKTVLAKLGKEDILN